MTNYRYLGYGVTDSNGVAHLDHDANGDSLSHSYTGVGAGEIDVLASLDNPIVDGSIVSETYSILDCIKYDKGILDDPQTRNIYDNVSANALTRTTEYTSLKEVTTGTDAVAFISDLPFECTIDFEVCQVDGETGNERVLRRNLFGDMAGESGVGINLQQ